MASSANSAVLEFHSLPGAAETPSRPIAQPSPHDLGHRIRQVATWMVIPAGFALAWVHWQGVEPSHSVDRATRLASTWLAAFVFLSRGIGASGAVATGLAIIYALHPLAGGDSHLVTDSHVLAGVIGIPIVGLLCLWSLRARRWPDSVALALLVAGAAMLAGSSAILVTVSVCALSAAVESNNLCVPAMASARSRWSTLVRGCMVIAATLVGDQVSRTFIPGSSAANAVPASPGTSQHPLAWVNCHGWLNEAMISLPDSLQPKASVGYLGLTLVLITWIALGQRLHPATDRRRAAATAVTLALGFLWLTRTGTSLHEQMREAFEQVTLRQRVSERAQNEMGIGLLLLLGVAWMALRSVRIALFDQRRSVASFGVPVLLVMAWWCIGVDIQWQQWESLTGDARSISQCVALLLVTAAALAVESLLATRATASAKWGAGLLIGSILLGDVIEWG